MKFTNLESIRSIVLLTGMHYYKDYPPLPNSTCPLAGRPVIADIDMTDNKLNTPDPTLDLTVTEASQHKHLERHECMIIQR